MESARSMREKWTECPRWDYVAYRSYEEEPTNCNAEIKVAAAPEMNPISLTPRLVQSSPLKSR